MIYHLSLLSLVFSLGWVPSIDMELAMKRAQINGTNVYVNHIINIPNWQPMCQEGVKGDYNDWTHARTSEGDDACDAYTMGNGRCVVQVGLDQNKLDGGVKELFLAKGNCAASKEPEERFDEHGRPNRLEGWGTPIMFCPTLRPIALYAVPKSGSTSAGNWLFSMDLQDKKKLLALAGEVLKGDPDKAAEYQTWAVSQDFPGSYIEIYKNFRNRLFNRSWNKDKNAEQKKYISFLPPAGYCPMCCARGHGRQKVLLARNPFIRLFSYFKMVVFEQPKYSSYYFKNKMNDFEHWVTKIFAHRKSDGSFDHDPMNSEFAGRHYCPPHCLPGWKNEDKQEGEEKEEKEKGEEKDGYDYGEEQKEVQQKKEPARLHCDQEGACDQNCPPNCLDPKFSVSAMDTWHVKPVTDFFRENITEPFMGSPKNLLDRFHVLHLETLADDIKDLEKLLCEKYNDCKPLPTYPSLRPHVTKAGLGHGGIEECKFDLKTVEFKNCSTTWKEIWTPKLLDLVTEHFAEDFDLLGYKNDPFDLMPTHRAPAAKHDEL